MKLLVAMIAGYAAIALETGLAPEFQAAGFAPNLVCLVVLYMVVNLGPRASIACAAAVGATADLVGAGAPGAHLAGFAAAAWCVGQARFALGRPAAWHAALLAMLLEAVASSVEVLFAWLQSGQAPVIAEFAQGLLAGAIATGLAAWISCLAGGAFSRRVQPLEARSFVAVTNEWPMLTR